MEFVVVFARMSGMTFIPTVQMQTVVLPDAAAAPLAIQLVHSFQPQLPLPAQHLAERSALEPTGDRQTDPKC